MLNRYLCPCTVILPRPSKPHAYGDAPGAALRVLSRQICLWLPKYIRTLALASPHEQSTLQITSIRQQHQATTYNSLSKLQSELATALVHTSSSSSRSTTYTGRRLFRRPQHQTLQASQLLQTTTHITMPAQRPSHLPPCPGPPPSRPLPPLPK